MEASMFEDPSFVVALSFLGFCAVVYKWQGKALWRALVEQVELRLDPIRKAEDTFNGLTQSWHQARHRMDQVTRDVQDIQQHYDDLLVQSIEKAQHREELWLNSRKNDMLAFQVFQQQQADKKALQTLLDEFVYESN